MLSKKHILVRCLKTSQKGLCSCGTVDLPETSIPIMGSTAESPLVYGYRTKLTPHFECPRKSVRGEMSSDEHPSWLKIGFNTMNRNTTMDIDVGLIFIYFTFNTEPSSCSF